MFGATAATVEAIRERLEPAVESFDENVRRQTRRAIVQGRHAAEDAAAAMVVRVRRHPLRAVAFAAGAGAVIGGLAGYALWLGRCRE